MSLLATSQRGLGVLPYRGRVSHPTRPAVVPVPVPALELWIGLAWWTVGAVAFDPGAGTVVLAAGLVVMGWLVLTVRRTHGSGAPLPRGGRGELLRRAGVTVGLIVAVNMGLGYAVNGEYAELAAPVACVLVGLALARSSRLLGGASTTLAGLAIVVLGVAGGVLALNTPGLLYGQGIVGLGAGAVLWLAGAYRTRVLAVPPGARR